MKRFFLLLLLAASFSSFAQQRPKLVVGLVVDQMRWDYLYRYQSRFSPNGFQRLLNEGFSCENAFIPYAPTVTAAGHASIYTGSVPAMNGIVGNNWYNRQVKKVVYCTDDSTVTGVGSSSAAGKMSPRNMWSNTVADELRLATNFRNKTIGIALKDRGSILPAGHMANAAYWFDNASGGWISSSYYMDDLPHWVKQFNSKKLPDNYLKQNWQTLYPINTYKQSTSDSNRYEGKLPGGKSVFPHLTATIENNRYDAFRNTPGSASFTLAMAEEAIRAERLGMRGETDFLAVSISSTDYIGHTFGTNSIEVEDAYLRLDRDVAAFLSFLDQHIGKGQYLLFLTADHGAAHNPLFIEDNKGAGGVFDQNGADKQLKAALEKQFGVANLIEYSINSQIYLDSSLMRKNNIDNHAVKTFITTFLLKYDAVSQVIDLAQLEGAPLPGQVRSMVRSGYNQKLSGDLQIIYKPQIILNWKTGTTHGLWNPYDARIPLVWFGWNVKKGKMNREVYMTDIAPTVAAFLKIQMPNASIGKVITEVVN